MKDLMTLQEVADYTGLKMGYLYQLTSKRKISSYKPMGKKLYFKKTEVDEFFFTNKRKSLAELEQEAINYSLTSKKR